MTRPFSHYYRACPFKAVDVYRIIKLFELDDPCLQHAFKKVLCGGRRGAKSADKDVAEAIASLQRWQEMRDEERDAEADQPVIGCAHNCVPACPACQAQKYGTP